jgi:hypothetical protein
MNYPIDIIVEYNDTAQFRELIRKVFKMDINKCNKAVSDIEQHNNETMDDVTRDEMLYDNESVAEMLEFIMNQTVHVDEFKDLYEKAALRMFSTDLAIGQAILFSYDYFYYFHLCLVEFFRGRFSTDFEPYVNLVKLLS